MKPIVFLHIPKTAGQTVHNEIARSLPDTLVSPIRVHHQARAEGQFPSGYQFYSGHLDWPDPAQFPEAPFMFTILRDPKERIASFYFYLLKEARKLPGTALAQPENTGKKMILTRSVDDYFFGGSIGWQTFIRNHYDNVYCRFFASRKLRGWSSTQKMTDAQLLNCAQGSFDVLDRVYHVSDLRPLEQDLRDKFGLNTTLVGNFHNAGRHPRSQPRWPRLLDLFESDQARQQIEAFTAVDSALLAQRSLLAVA